MGFQDKATARRTAGQLCESHDVQGLGSLDSGAAVEL